MKRQQIRMSTAALIGTLMFSAVALTVAQIPDAAENSGLPKNKFPAMVKSIDGERLDIRKLGKGRRVVVVTLKATWCPVCQRQLFRIQQRISELDCGVTFLVLSPGPASELKAIQKQTGFPYPFIEDENLTIAKSLGLNMSETEIFPSIFILGKDLEVRWMQKGRNAAYYGDKQLTDVINCAGLI